MIASCFFTMFGNNLVIKLTLYESFFRYLIISESVKTNILSSSEFNQLAGIS